MLCAIFVGLNKNSLVKRQMLTEEGSIDRAEL